MNIGVVIVTYNRKEMLEQTLRRFSMQTKKPAYIIVVNNASSDETEHYLTIWEEEKEEYLKIVLNLNDNMGGSGGFYEGLKYSLKCDADWVWVSDDDAIPELNALEEAYSYLDSHKGSLNQISAICGQVINYDKIDINHRKNYLTKGIRILEMPIAEEEYEKREFELNAFSYVGTIISCEKMKRVGLTLKDYFIWWDDTEHSLRLSKVGKIICVPAIRIHHDVGGGDFEINWKTYYGFRNMTDMYKRHMPLPCFIYFSIKVIIKTTVLSVFSKKSVEMLLLKKGFWDALTGKFGVDSVYKPGWKYSK
jgi:GT2 family glycosyltransferase